MKTIRFFLLWCMVVAISACTPFYRGFEGSTLVSPARPDVSVSVVDMPMLAHGQIAPFLNTDQGYQFPETLVSVYGTDAASPVAIVALSFVPSNAWEWDPLSFSGPMAQQNMGRRELLRERPHRQRGQGSFCAPVRARGAVGFP